MNGIRAQTSFRIEALEAALIESKIKCDKERNRAEMQLNEMQSKMENMLADAKDDSLQRV